MLDHQVDELTWLIDYLLSLRKKKECFLCKTARGCGTRFIVFQDLIRLECLLDGKLYCNDDCKEVMRISKQFGDISFIDIISLLLQRVSKYSEEELMSVFDVGRSCGVPVCWRDCELSGQILVHLYPPLSTRAVQDIVIQDEPFHIGYINYNPLEYHHQLDHKKNLVIDILKSQSILLSLDGINIEVNESPIKNFRQRCRFSIAHPTENTIDYLMWEEDGSPAYRVLTFPIASLSINIIMPILKMHLEIVENNVLRDLLNSVQFLSSLTNNVIITLIYDKFIDDTWKLCARKLKEYFTVYFKDDINSIHLIGRGLNKSKVVIDQDYITESFHLSDGRDVKYIQVVNGFSNPNASVNIKSIEFMASIISSIPGLGCVDESGSRYDVLEMYCGMGNHTVALAMYAKRIVAVELNKHLCSAAIENLALNNISNARIITGDSAKFAQNVLRRKKYNSKEGDEYIFGAVIVDPPRCGLDEATRALVCNYEHVIYISCSPKALARDLKDIIRTHVMVRFAVFDHFAYTPHVECGVYLKRSV